MACIAYSFHYMVISLNCRWWKGALGRAGKRHFYGESGVLLLSFGRIRLVILVLRLRIHSKKKKK